MTGPSPPDDGRPAEAAPSPRDPETDERQAASRSVDLDREEARAELFLARLVGLLLVAALVLGRALASALPGTVTGIGPWIDRAALVGSFASQLALFAGVAVFVLLLVATLRRRELGISFRLVAVPMGAGIVTIVMSSAREPLEAQATLILAVGTALLAISAAIPMSMVGETRAPGAVVGLVAVASLVTVGARYLAVRASLDAEPGLFMIARGITTAGFAVDALAVGLAALWVGVRGWRAASIAGAAVVGLAMAVTFGALRGSLPDAPLWQVLASRALAELTREPPPLVAAGPAYFLEVASIALAACILAGARRAPLARAVVALAVLCRASTDLPLGALPLAIAALLGPAAAVRAGRARGRPTSARIFVRPGAVLQKETATGHAPERTPAGARVP